MIPVCITHTVSERPDYCKYYQINSDNLNSNSLKLINADVTAMFKDLMDNITSRVDNRSNNRVIFVHNLGGFDGIFIHKALVNLYGKKVECLIDDSNSYISITYNGEIIDTSLDSNKHLIEKWTKKDKENNKYKIEFKDSCRLFPVTLDQLCKVFEVKGKISKYNPAFNEISLFKDTTIFEQFKQYAKQDTVALFNALTKARELYGTDWDVDIIHCYSSANLSLRIFRHEFMENMKDYICVLSNSQDRLVRKSYFGGARLAAIITKRMVKIYTIMM